MRKPTKILSEAASARPDHETQDVFLAEVQCLDVAGPEKLRIPQLKLLGAQRKKDGHSVVLASSSALYRISESEKHVLGGPRSPAEGFRSPGPD